METIEYTDKNFNSRIDILSNILQKNGEFASFEKNGDKFASFQKNGDKNGDKFASFEKNGEFASFEKNGGALADKLKQVQDRYDSISVNILHKYYTGNLTDSEKNIIVDDYHKLVLKESIYDDIQIVADAIRKEKNPKILAMMRDYKKIPAYRSPSVATTYKNVKQGELCSTCNGCMFMNNETSEMMCSQCGEIQPIIGTVFDDLQIYYQEGPCSKHASYERIKHGEKWLLKIQAKENVDIKKEIINDVKRQMRHKDITDVRKVTHDLIRECLRKAGHTKYNEHISLIKKIITGISPPQLTEKEQSITLYYFDLIVEIFEQKKPKYKHNCPYHPFFIFKILEQEIVLKEDTLVQMNRKRKILSNIHIQSENTIRKRDKFWKIICVEITEFVYIPTDRNKYKIPI